MTTDDDKFIGLLETYLDDFDGVTPLPDPVRDRVRALLPRTKQVGSRVGLTRFSDMSNAFRISIAAAVIGVAALLGYAAFTSRQVGPAPDATATPTAAASAAVPSELQHSFVGEANPVEGVRAATGAVLRISANELHYWLEAGDYFGSTASIDADGRLRLVATSVIGGCQPDQAGSYEFSRSPGGTRLTLSGTDACQARLAALSGEWLRAACRDPDNDCLGVVEAGSYASLYFEPRRSAEWHPRFGAFTYTLPEGWAVYTDYPDDYGLAPQDAYEAAADPACYACAGTNPAVAVLSDPGPASPDCLETGVEGVGSTGAELAAWLASHPGLVATNQGTTSVNGNSAWVLDLAVADDWTGTCDQRNPVAAVAVFYREGSFHQVLPMGDRWHVVLIDIGGGHTVAVVVDGDAQSLDTFVDEVTPIIDTFAFREP
jgi:hypothetical protein